MPASSPTRAASRAASARLSVRDRPATRSGSAIAGADALARIERRERVLEDHLQLVPVRPQRALTRAR